MTFGVTHWEYSHYSGGALTTAGAGNGNVVDGRVIHGSDNGPGSTATDRASPLRLAMIIVITRVYI